MFHCSRRSIHSVLHDLYYQQVPGIEIHNIDIAGWDKTRTLVQSIGPIDLLVNNAGITDWTAFADVTKAQLDKYV